jgi:MATE family multidrug resistance protein
MTAVAAAAAEVRSLVRLAIPLIIGLAAANVIGLTDTLMVAPLGAAPLGAVGLTSSVVIIAYAAIYGALSTIGIGVAQAHGAKATGRIAGLVRNGLALGLVVGVIAACLVLAAGLALPLLGQPPDVLAVIAPYWISMALLLIPFALLIVMKQLFDSIDRPWLGVGFAFLATGVNVPLNWVLIYGPGPLPALGLLGAGVASLVSESVGFATAYLYWRRARSTRRLRIRAPVTRAEVGRIGAEGAPLGLMYAAETGAYALAGVMIGWFGAAALAANQVVNAVGAILYMLPLGMAGAVAIRVGQASGAGEQARLRPIAFAALGVVSGWMLLVTGALAVSRETLAGWIAPDAEVAALAATLFLVTALMQVADGVQSTALGALRGLMDLKWPTAVSLVAYWLIALPAAYLFAFALGMGPAGIWAGFAAGLAVAAIALPVRFLGLTRAPR